MRLGRLRRSPWIGVVAAAAALVCAVAAANGPARAEAAVVRWPAPAEAAPAVPGVAEPRGQWYTPLLLSAHSPARLTLSLPCTIAPDPRGPVLVFATTRGSDVGRGLTVIADRATLTLTVRDDRLVRTPWAASSEDCTGALDLRDGTWVLTRAGQVVASGQVDAPDVSGLYTELDPRGPSPVRAEVTAATYGSRPSTRQWVLNAAAVVCAALALLCLGRGARGRDSLRRPRGHPVDAVVVTVLAIWWLFGPWFFDDGWLMATVRSRSAGGTFSNYFDTLGAQLPLGFGDHLLLWPLAAVDAPFLWWRLVPVLACTATWALLRVAYATIAGADAPVVGLVTLGLGYIVFAMAWLITLRPESIVALLSSVVLVGVIAYERTQSRRLLAVALIAAAAATTLHPSGLVGGAPLVVAIPALLRDARRGLAHALELSSLALVALTTAVILLFADADIARWRELRAVFAGDKFHSRGVTDEALRYHDLLTNGSIPALASVLFGGLALALFASAWLTDLAAGRASSEHHLDVAGWSLLVAVALLTTTPSKWIYHFGSAAAIASFAIGIEALRVAQLRGRRGTIARAGAAVVVVLLVARSFRDPRDAQYFMRIDTPRASVLGRVVVWSGIALLTFIVARAWPTLRRRAALDAWVVPCALGVVVAGTVATFAVAPLLDGPAWSIPRVSVVDAFDGCTFAGRVDVSDPREAALLTPAAAGASELPAEDAAALHPPPRELEGALVHSTDVDGEHAVGTLTTPWFELSATAGDVVIAVAGRVEPNLTTLDAEWSSDFGAARQPIGRTPIIVRRNLNPLYGEPTWRMIRLVPPEMPDAPRLAVRFVARDNDPDPGGFIAVSQPVSVRHRSLVSYLDGRTVLVSPPQLPLLACTTPPAIRAGVAAMPDVTIGFEYREAVNDIPELGSPTGPWYLAEDAYATRRLWAWLTDRDAFTVTIRDDAPSADQEVAAELRSR